MRTLKKKLSSRKQPSQARSLRMVDIILESASRVLEKSALAGYNTTAVAELAGVSIGSVYQYFPNRDALTTELILKMHRTLVSKLRAALVETKGLDFQESLPALIQAGIPSDIKLARVLEFEEERLPRGAELNHLEQEIAALVVQYLNRYVKAKVSIAVVELAALDMVSIIRGMIDSSINRSSEIDDLTERIGRAIVGYLAPLVY